MRQQFRVERFGVFLPAGAARCELGRSFWPPKRSTNSDASSICGICCRDFRVPTVREAQQFPEGGQHLPSSHSFDRQAKGFAERIAYGQVAPATHISRGFNRQAFLLFWDP